MIPQCRATMALMSWEESGHAESGRSKWALPFAGVLLVGTLGLGQGLVSSRAHRLLGSAADTEGWAIDFSRPAFVQSNRNESGMWFFGAALGPESPTIHIIRFQGDQTADIEQFCAELWQKMFGTPVSEGHLSAITLGGIAAWEVIGPDGAEAMRLLTTATDETYAFAFSAGAGPNPSRAQFDALCDSIRLKSPR